MRQRTNLIVAAGGTTFWVEEDHETKEFWIMAPKDCLIGKTDDQIVELIDKASVMEKHLKTLYPGYKVHV